jgi:hypothetical protein
MSEANNNAKHYLPKAETNSEAIVKKLEYTLMLSASPLALSIHPRAACCE